MQKRYNGNGEITIKIIADKIKKEITKDISKIRERQNVKDSFQKGKLKSNNWKNIKIGLNFIDEIEQKGFSVIEQQLLTGEDDVNKIKKELFCYKKVIEDVVDRILVYSNKEYELQRKIELLYDYSQISQAARDGIILKQEKRIEIIDGQEEEIIYDTSMTPREVISILKDYETQVEIMSMQKLNYYLSLGLGLAGTFGTLIKNKKDKNNSIKDSISLITVSTVASSGLELLYEVVKSNNMKKYRQMGNEQVLMENELLENEQVSIKSENDSIENIREIINKRENTINQIENSEFFCKWCLTIANAIISGVYINKNIKIKENGKIDGRSLANAIISLNASQKISKDFTKNIKDVVRNREKKTEFKELCDKVQEILDQFDEKVLPLEGAKHSFNSFSINNFVGKFYPKKDYKNGNVNFSVKLEVPEFSMQRGDVVLLSGESGSGKSTFLRFLKRGDINNRYAIKLDNGEKVDGFGTEYLYFRPSMNLGDETNVLYQITRKKNLSDLNIDERSNLEKLLRELKFNMPNLLYQLSTKKFMEFSTGQQRRLVLSKIFYRINEGASVIIVDEPVGNVEDSLVREQLEMIKRYAQDKDLMLLLTTHRLDLVQDLVTKRYNITNDGKLEQIPIIKNEIENREI